jgi:hypothetical protein
MGIGYEADIESDVNLDATTGPGGIVFVGTALGPGNPTYGYGMVMDGATSHAITAGFLLNGNAAGFNRGYVSQGVINMASFVDYATSPVAFQLWGTNTTGIDMANATISGRAINFSGSATYINPEGTFKLNNGELHSGGDTNLLLTSSGTATPAWAFQTVSSGGTAGRLRIYDTTTNTEVMSFLQGSAGIVVDTPAAFAGTLNLAGITGAANCSGQPSGNVIATTGTGALVKCP